jgi:short-subunit dehydrogenase
MAEMKNCALVTGASSGIGFELAKQFAEHGYDLVVAAEDDGIHSAAETLARTGVDVEAVQVDLRTAEGVERLYKAAIDGRQLSAAAINAGIGAGGTFIDSDLAEDLSIVDLNVRSTMHLSKLVLADMVAADSGRVLFTSSVAAMMPGSYQSVYNASKSFIQSFAEALRDELRNTSVTVTALMPGPTETNFFHRAGLDGTPMGKMPKDDPAEVARQGFDALMHGEQKVVAESFSSKLMGLVSRVLPDAVKAAGSRIISAPLKSVR